jgi:hypothetical protein
MGSNRVAELRIKSNSGGSIPRYPLFKTFKLFKMTAKKNNISEQLLEELIAQYGKDNVLDKTLKDADGKEVRALFRKPSTTDASKIFALYSQVMQHIRKDNLLEAGYVIANNCFISGDESAKNRNSLVGISFALALSSELDFFPVGDSTTTKN